MTIGRVVALVAAAALWLSPSLLAHHSGADYAQGKRVTVKGVVKEWVYVNPHCFLVIEVMDDKGELVRWTAETQAPSIIFPVGYRRDTFKAGDVVTLTVEPAKDGRPLGRIMQTVLPNGTTLGPANDVGLLERLQKK